MSLQAMVTFIDTPVRKRLAETLGADALAALEERLTSDEFSRAPGLLEKPPISSAWVTKWALQDRDNDVPSLYFWIDDTFIVHKWLDADFRTAGRLEVLALQLQSNAPIFVYWETSTRKVLNIAAYKSMT